MSASIRAEFSQGNIDSTLTALSKAELDTLDFGVIGFDKDGIVRLYNEFESRMAGLSLERVLGQRHSCPAAAQAGREFPSMGRRHM